MEIVREFLDAERTKLARAQLRSVLNILLKGGDLHHHEELYNFDFIARLLNVDGYQYAKPAMSDYSFVMELLAEDPRRWVRLPPYLTDDGQFVKHCLPAMNAFILSLVLKHHPSFRDDREFWQYYIERSRAGGRGLAFSDDLHVYAPDSIKSDVYLMASAASVSSRCLLFVSQSLWERKSFVACLLHHDPENLRYLNTSVQSQFPDLVAKSFSKFRQLHRGDNRYFHASECAKCVSKTLWEKRVFLEAWFRAGLPFLHKHFPRVLRNDETLFLLLAEHGRFKSPEPRAEDLDYLKTFIMASPDLKRDKAFMMKAIELDSYVWQYTAAEIFYDPDILLLAFSGLKSNTCLFSNILASSSHHRRRSLLPDYFATVQSKLSIYDDFLSVVLPAMTFPRPQCLLSRLNQGGETGQCFRKSIASYLGVPVGKELRLLRRAKSNLAGIVYWY